MADNGGNAPRRAKVSQMDYEIHRVATNARPDEYETARDAINARLDATNARLDELEAGIIDNNDRLTNIETMLGDMQHMIEEIRSRGNSGDTGGFPGGGARLGGGMQ